MLSLSLSLSLSSSREGFYHKTKQQNKKNMITETMMNNTPFLILLLTYFFLHTTNYTSILCKANNLKTPNHTHLIYFNSIGSFFFRIFQILTHIEREKKRKWQNPRKSKIKYVISSSRSQSHSYTHTQHLSREKIERRSRETSSAENRKSLSFRVKMCVIESYDTS